MRFDYVKMNGIGNDFIIIDGRQHSLTLTREQIIRLCHRQNGIGCDQLIVIEPSQRADFLMRIFNSSGDETGACGNGTRCVAHLFALSNPKQHIMIETTTRLLAATIVNNDKSNNLATVSVDMGEPLLASKDIPLSIEYADTAKLDLQFLAPDSPLLSAPAAVNVGNPHIIFWVGKLDDYQLGDFGSELEHHPLFPAMANISLAEIVNSNKVRLNVWERGAGLTKACGSAACSVVVAGKRNNLLDRYVTVELPGGDLTINWRKDNNHIMMIGASQLDYYDTITIT